METKAMYLNWADTWTDIVETSHQVLQLCEERLNCISPNQQARSRESLEKVREDLQNDLDYVTHKPHFFSTQLALVAVRIISRIASRRDPAEREAARRLANFCGIVFQYRRSSDPDRYENHFRCSLEAFLTASLPELVPQVFAADMIEDVRAWLGKFYDRVPPDLSFLITYETHRSSLDRDETHGLMLRFVEDNRDIASLEASDKYEDVHARWERLYRKSTGESLDKQPPEELLSPEVRERLKAAVRENDPMEVRDILAPLEAGLIEAVRVGLDVTFDIREPRRAIKDRNGKPSADFETARRQLRSNNRQAVANFRGVWQNQQRNHYAKEWYAYALAKPDGSYRQAKTPFEDIRRDGRGDQLTDWNLACCEVLSEDREAGFDILRQSVEAGSYIDVVLEPAIALGLERKEKKFLAENFDWLPQEEAILLGYFYAADTGASTEELEEWLPGVGKIASDRRGFRPPDPAADLRPQNLNRLCFDFIERRMLRGAISWFRQRVSLDQHKFYYLNLQL